MDDCLQAATPFPGDGQHAIAVLDPIVVVQDKFNDQMNYIAEVFDYGAPSTFVNADNNEYAAIVNQRAEPYSFRQLKAQNGMKMTDMFYREPNPEVPATMQPYLEFLMGPLPQFMTATPPAVWGESTPDTKTASGLAQSRNQALGRLGIIWSVLQWTDARMYYQAALAAANDPATPESITVPVKEGSNVVIRVERLRKGHFMAVADDDSGFPESTQALRGIFTQVMQLAGQFPPLAAQLFNPENLQTMLRTYGLTELVIPEAQSGQKQMEEIEILLEGVPVDPTPEEIAAEQQKFAMMSQVAVQMGAPPLPPFDPQSLVRSSVPIQPWDHDDYEAEKCQDWLNSDACRVELQVGRPDPVTGVMTPNLRGVANVEAHRQEHLKALAAKMPPPMPGGAPDAVSGGTGTPPKPKAMILPTSAPVGTPGTIAQ
jgi:hypothetical protein